MDWRLFIAPIFILWLVAMLYVGPSYFRRLGQFIARLESHHERVYDRLGQPSLSLADIRISSTLPTVWFVARKKYGELADEKIVQLGDAVRIRLLISMAGIVYLVVAIPIAATYQPF